MSNEGHLNTHRSLPDDVTREEDNIVIFGEILNDFEEAEMEIFGPDSPETNNLATVIEEKCSSYSTKISDSPIVQSDDHEMNLINAPNAHVTENGTAVKGNADQLEISTQPLAGGGHAAVVPITGSQRRMSVRKNSISDSRKSEGSSRRGSRKSLPRHDSFVKVSERIVNGSARNGKAVLSGMNFFMADNSLRLNTGNIRTVHLSVVLSILQDPIQCGYLLNFCTKEHNSENLCFIMMVSRFRDAVGRDISSWPKSWEELDKELEGKDEKELVTNAVWPSTRLQKPVIQKLIQSIWDSFLSNDAVTQICMPAKIAVNTKRRIQLMDYYGPDIFTEALFDPMKTLSRDVLPRFLASADYTDMQNRIAELKTKVMISNIEVSPPSGSPLLESNETFTEKRSFTLQEVVSNNLLYNDFLEHLHKSMAVENLLCYRMINIFEEILELNTESSLVEATDQAWKVYKYFVAPEAPFEVSLHSRHKKELMISLAKVTPLMFDELKKSALSVLSVNFNGYKFSESYRGLWKVIKEHKTAATTRTSMHLPSLSLNFFKHAAVPTTSSTSSKGKVAFSA